MLEKPLYTHFSNAEGDDHLGFAIVCWTSVGVCFFSLLCGVAIVASDLIGERQGVVPPEHGIEAEDKEAPLLEKGVDVKGEDGQAEEKSWDERILDIRRVLGFREMLIYIAGVAFYLRCAYICLIWQKVLRL